MKGDSDCLYRLFFHCCRLKHNDASAGNPDTTPAEPHPTSNTQQTKNETADVVIQHYNRKILMMGIVMPETC